MLLSALLVKLCLNNLHLVLEIPHQPSPIAPPILSLNLNVCRVRRQFRERILKHDRHLLCALLDIFILFILLLDRIVFELHGKDGAVLIGYLIKSTNGLPGIEVDEFRDHQVAEHFDFVIVAKAGDHTVIEVGAIEAAVVAFHECVEGFVGTLLVAIVSMLIVDSANGG